MNFEILPLLLVFIILVSLSVLALCKWYAYYHIYIALAAYFFEQLPDESTLLAWDKWAKDKTVRKLLRRPLPDSIPERAGNYHSKPIKAVPESALDEKNLQAIEAINSLVSHHLWVALTEPADAAGVKRQQTSKQFLRKHFRLMS